MGNVFLHINYAALINKGKCKLLEEKGKLYRDLLVLQILIFVFMAPLVDANFACGAILDTNEMSASWFTVRIFYPENISRFTECDVSPAGNKYCCDTEAIPGKTWKIGNAVGSEIYSEKYAAGPVSLVSSGEGYDVFPEMELRKVISLNASKVKIGSSNFSVFGEVAEPYTFVSYMTGNSSGVVCENCSNFSLEFMGEFGMNYLEINATGSVYGVRRAFRESLGVAILENAGLERDFSCRFCDGNRIREGSVVNVSLRMGLSHAVEMQAIEYVPILWEILDSGGGMVMQYSSTHNMIVWNVSGNVIERGYVVRAPRVRFLPVRYIFAGSLEDYFFPEEEIVVYGFWPFFSTYEEANFTRVKYKAYSFISPDRPLVVSYKGLHIQRMALYPIEEKRNVFFEIRNYTGSMDDSFDYYSLETSLNLSEIDRILIEFKAGKRFLAEQGFENVSVYSFFDDRIYPASIIRENNRSIFYSANIPGSKGFAFIGIRRGEGFFDMLWRNIAFWGDSEDEEII